MKRRQISPLRLRPKKIDVDINKIINHAAKLVMEYNQIKIDNIMQSEMENQEKINKLLRLSTENFPRIISKPKKTKRPKPSSKKQASKSDCEDLNEDHIYSQRFDDSSKREESLRSRSSNKRGSVDDQCVSIDTDKSKKSSLSNISLPKSQRSLQHIDVVIKDNRRHSNRTMDEVMSMPSESFPSYEQLEEIENKTESDKMTGNQFIYDVEIKTGEENNTSLNTDVFLILNGETMTTTRKLCLTQYFKSDSSIVGPFQSGNLDNFQIFSPVYIGAIKNIVIGLESPSQDESWFLEYICVKDLSVSKEYRFPCRRWLGNNSADQLTGVTLGYTPSYKQGYNSTKSMSLEDTKTNNENVILSNQPSQLSLTNNNSFENEPISKEEVLHLEPNHKLENSNTNSSVKINESADTVNSKSFNTDHQSNISNEEPVLSGKSIHSAVKSNDYERVKELCSFNDTLKCCEDEDGNTPIHLAAIYYEDSQIINYLISLTVEPNLKSRDGYTPFLLAIIHGNLDSVKYLNEKIKVNRDIRDNDENTALYLATLKGHEHIVRYLLSEMVEHPVNNQLCETRLHIEQDNGDVGLINVLPSVKGTGQRHSSDDKSYTVKIDRKDKAQGKENINVSLNINNNMVDREKNQTRSEETVNYAKSSPPDSINENRDHSAYSSLNKRTDEDNRHIEHQNSDVGLINVLSKVTTTDHRSSSDNESYTVEIDRKENALKKEDIQEVDAYNVVPLNTNNNIVDREENQTHFEETVNYAKSLSPDSTNDNTEHSASSSLNKITEEDNIQIDEKNGDVDLINELIVVKGTGHSPSSDHESYRVEIDRKEEVQENSVVDREINQTRSEETLNSGKSASSDSTNHNTDHYAPDSLNKITAKDNTSNLHPNVKSQKIQNERIQPELDNNSLNNDNEYDEDNRGIIFNKRFPVIEDKRDISRPSIDIANLRTVRFNDDTSSEYAGSEDHMSPISSGTSSPLSPGISDSDSGSLKQRPLQPDTHNDELVTKERQLSPNEAQSKLSPSEDPLKPNEDIDEIKEKDLMIMNSEHSKTGETTVNEIESTRIGEINKSLGLQHSI